METIKEGETIFVIDPENLKRASVATPDVTAMFASIGEADGHEHGAGGACQSEAMLKVAELMAGSASPR
jgi:hypothetical protein